MCIPVLGVHVRLENCTWARRGRRHAQAHTPPPPPAIPPSHKRKKTNQPQIKKTSAGPGVRHHRPALRPSQPRNPDADRSERPRARPAVPTPPKAAHATSLIPTTQKAHPPQARSQSTRNGRGPQAPPPALAVGNAHQPMRRVGMLWPRGRPWLGLLDTGCEVTGYHYHYRWHYRWH